MKIDEADFRNVPQEVIDFKDQVITLLNYGKYQPQVITGIPGWRARQGEFVWVITGGFAYMYMCTSDNNTTWKAMFSANIS